MKREFQIAFLKSVGLRPEHHLLDIGCGTLRGGIPLIDFLQEGHYYGIEARREALEEGRKELQEAGLAAKRPVLLVADEVERDGLPQRFEFIWAFSVLIHMSDEIAAKTIALVARQLGEGGVFYANVNIGSKPDSTWDQFPLVWRPLEFYRGLCARHGLELADVGSIRDHGHITNVGTQDSQRMLRISRALA
jgi:cyclopropane fatty-acyl-phospholipid synthase-like methyltransferase